MQTQGKLVLGREVKPPSNEVFWKVKQPAGGKTSAAFPVPGCQTSGQDQQQSRRRECAP